jgi:Ca2+-binding RTX toxin-like protein
LTANSSITATGTQALTITTLPDLGTGSFSAAAATGKITVTANAADSASITGGSAGDVLSGAAGSDTISGGAGNDTIAGGDTGQNVLSGDAGNDLLTGGSASDTINGGDGNDVITGGGASDTLSGDAGNDSITGGSGNDTILGGDGNDTLIGGGGTDSLLGGAGNDSITGGAAAETINGGAGADTLTGGGANDTFVFAVGDSLSTSFDTITDLTKGDIIKIGGYGISGLTTATNIGTSATSATAKEVYIDATNKFLVIETAADGSTVEKIAIQGAAASAPFKYYDNGTAADLTDDYLVVGASSLTSTVSAGKLTLAGEAGALAEVVLGLSGATVYGSAVTGGYATSIDATALSVASGSTGMSQSVTATIASDLVITGSDLVDTLAGGLGADIISGGVGDDNITGKTSSVTIDGSDTLSGGTGADTFNYLLQADLVGSSGSTVIDSIIGGDGIDIIAFGTSGTPFTITNQDVWTRVSGVESLIPNANSSAVSISLDVTAEAAGIRTVNFGVNALSNASNVIDASEYVAAGLTLTGAAASTSITGGAGNDTITGGAASDSLVGGSGDDSITGANGNDTITGGAGNDLMIGGAGTDTFNVDAGTDTISDWGASSTADVLSISSGAIAKIVVAAAGADITTFNPITNSGTLYIDGSAATGAVTITGSTGVDSITGGSASDTINGGSGNDIINAGGGSNTVNGGDGDDIIIGGSAIDNITGGAGIDTITGGTGADVFTIAAGGSTVATATAVTDVITDFVTTSDKIALVAGTSSNYSEVLTPAADLTTLLTAANTALDGTILLYFGVVGANGYLITDDSIGAGANNIIQLTGVTDIAYGDIIA